MRPFILFVAALWAVTAAPACAGPDRQQEVVVKAGAITLAGTLHRPGKGPGNRPAVVIVHGSGKTTREAASFWVDAAVRAGLVTLVLDKRGTGKSGGDYPPWDVRTTPAMFSDLAADVEHAVRWLAKQPGVDPRRIGLVGGSQAGWIMPLAASREPLIRFLFIGEGVPLPAGIEEAHSTYLDGVATYGEARPTLRQIAAADVFAEDFIGERGYDPAPVLSGIGIPVMWTFGLYDEAIPTRASIDRIGQLQKAGKANFDLHLFPFGDHNFRNVFTRERYDVSAILRDWLERRGVLRAAGAPRP